MEIKNKLTVTRRERDNGRKKGKGHQGAFIKDTWTKPKGIGLRMGGGNGWEWWGGNGDTCT